MGEELRSGGQERRTRQISTGGMSPPIVLVEGDAIGNRYRSWTRHPFTGRMDYERDCLYGLALEDKSNCLRAERLALIREEWKRENPRAARRKGVRGPDVTEFLSLPIFCQSCIVATNDPKTIKERQKGLKRAGKAPRTGFRGRFTREKRRESAPQRRVIERELEEEPKTPPRPVAPVATPATVFKRPETSAELVADRPPASATVEGAAAGAMIIEARIRERSSDSPGNAPAPVVEPARAVIRCERCSPPRDVPAEKWAYHQSWHKGQEARTAKKPRRRG